MLIPVSRLPAINSFTSPFPDISFTSPVACILPSQNLEPFLTIE